MAQPSTRSEFKQYCLRQLGAPVLEINVAEEQCEDLIDDALQFFHERHFDGVINSYLKYKVTQDDINRGKGPGQAGVAGITTSSATSTIDGAEMQFDWKENSNYLEVPPSVIGVNKVFHFDGTNTMTNNMFSVKYQLFLNDIYYWGAVELLSYAMTKTYLSDIEFLITTQKQFRFNQRQDRLYLDIDWDSMTVGDYLIMDCYVTLNPNDFSMIGDKSESYGKILEFISKKKSVTKKEILDYLGWGVRISFSGYRNRLRIEDSIRFTKNRYEVI